MFLRSVFGQHFNHPDPPKTLKQQSAEHTDARTHDVDDSDSDVDDDDDEDEDEDEYENDDDEVYDDDDDDDVDDDAHGDVDGHDMTTVMIRYTILLR